MSFSSAIKTVSPDARAGCLGHYRPGSGIPMPHLSVLFSFLLDSASEARQVRFRAAVGAQRTSSAVSITDPMHDPMTPSPVAPDVM
jgi:hypothetical protein